MHQAIYTNDGGWKITDASPELPAEIAEQVGKFNDSLIRTYEEYGTSYTKRIFIFKCVENYAYYLCANREGRVDQSGRNSLLVHCYANTLEGQVDEFIASEDYIMAFSIENYSDQIKRGDIIFDTPLSIDEAMMICKMSSRDLTQLLRCVYAVLFESTDTTLNIHVPDEKYIKAIMQCIYHVMPYSIRKLVSYSSAPIKLGVTTIAFVTPDIPVGQSRNKILSHEAQGGLHLYIDTMEMSGFDEDILQNVKRDTAFNDELCENATTPIIREMLLKYQELEEDLKLSASDNASRHIKNIQTLFQLLRFSNDVDLNHKEIMQLTSQILRFRNETEFTNYWLIKLIIQCEQRGIILGESASSAMKKKYSSTRDESLKEAIFRFNCVNTLKQTQGEQIESLKKTFLEDKELFYKTLKCLRDNDNSLDKVSTSRTFDNLFAKEIGPSLLINTIQDLKQFLEYVNRAAYSPRPLVEKFKVESLIHVFKYYIQRTSYDKEQFIQFYTDYCNYAKSILSQEENNDVSKKIKTAYWHNFNITSIDREFFDVYKLMLIEVEHSDLTENVERIIAAVENNNITLSKFAYKTSVYINGFQDYKEQEAVLEFMTQMAIYKYPTNSSLDSYLDGWIDYAEMYISNSSALNNIYGFAIKYNIEIMLNAFAYRDTTRKKDELSKILNQAISYMETGGNGSALLQDVIEEIKKLTRNTTLQKLTGFLKKK